MEQPVDIHRIYPTSTDPSIWEKLRRWDKPLMLFVLLAFLAAATALFIITIPLINLSLLVLGLQIDEWIAFTDWISQGNIGLIIFAVSGLLALLFAALARYRVKRIPALYIRAGCPRCHEHELIRVRRWRRDRVLSSAGIPVRRYACRNCTWQGLRLADKRKKVQKPVEKAKNSEPAALVMDAPAAAGTPMLLDEQVVESVDSTTPIAVLETQDFLADEELLADAFNKSSQEPHAETLFELVEPSESSYVPLEPIEASPDLLEDDHNIEASMEWISQTDEQEAPDEHNVVDDALQIEETIIEEHSEENIEEHSDMPSEPIHEESSENELDQSETHEIFNNASETASSSDAREEEFLFSGLDDEMDGASEFEFAQGQEEAEKVEEDNDDADPDFDKLCIDSVWD